MSALHFSSLANPGIAACRVQHGLHVTQNFDRVTCKACLKRAVRRWPELLGPRVPTLPSRLELDAMRLVERLAIQAVKSAFKKARETPV
jgi:hypothetical protein